MWLQWIAVTLLVILCINSVGTIALSAESQKEGNISETEFREEKSIPKKEFREEEKTLEKGNTPEEVQEEKSIPEGKNLLRNRDHERHHQRFRRLQKDLTLIFLSSLMEKG